MAVINSQLTQGYTGYFNGAGITSLIPAGSGAAGQSSTVTCGGNTLCGVYMPGTFTGATISFLVAPETTPGSGSPGTLSPLYNGSTLYSLTATAGAYIAVNSDLFQGAAFVAVKSASTESAQRTLILSLKGLS